MCGAFCQVSHLTDAGPDHCTNLLCSLAYLYFVASVDNLSATTIFQFHLLYEIIWVHLIDDDERFSDIITQ